jgi:hypothetical protein
MTNGPTTSVTVVSPVANKDRATRRIGKDRTGDTELIYRPTWSGGMLLVLWRTV